MTKGRCHFGVVLVIAFVAAICGSNKEAEAANPAVVAGLAQVANDFGAPFVKSASDRLHSSVFGSGRATRSTDIVIINRTQYTFKLVSESTGSGGWTGSLLPVYSIPPKSSVICGAESHGFATGVTGAKLRYQSTINSGKGFELRSSNPYIGRNSQTGRGFGGIRVHTTAGTGNNNIVRFVIE